MRKEEKVESVRRLREDIQKSGSLLLTDYRGLNVREITALRRKLRECGAEYKVVRNTLFKLAAADVPGLEIDEMLAGPTAVAFVHDDAVLSAKTIADFIKDHKPIAIKGGYVEGQTIGAAEVEVLSKVPPRGVLYAQLLGSMQSPMTGLVVTLQGVVSNFVYTLQAVVERKTASK